MAKKSMVISGRQLLLLTYEQYALDPSRGSYYGLNHLMNLKYPGDANIEQFLLTWDETVEGLSKPQPHDVLEAILWKQIESSMRMAQPLSRYQMAKAGSSKRTYKYLHGTLARYVKEDRNQKNHSELLAAKNGVKTARAMAGVDAERDAPQATEETTVTVAAPAANAPKAACYNFIKGTCTRGDKCAYSHDPKAELPKAERDRLDKAKEKREKDMKGKRSKAPCKNHAEGHCKFGDSCQFSHAAPATVIAATGCCIDLQGDDDIENESDGEIIYVTLPAVDTAYCMAAQKHMHRIQEWGLDSGSENHLVDGRRFTPRDFEVNGVTMNRPMKLATANGVINANTRMMMDVSILGNTIDPIVLENTVDVLSLGRLVIDNGYDFHWTKGHGATLIIDGGKEIKCPIKGYVPMLIDADIMGSSAHEAPALPSRVTIDDEQYHVPVPEVELEGDVEVHGLPDLDTAAKDKLVAEATSIRHMMTHRPKNPMCEICLRAKAFKSQARRKGPAHRQAITEFGDIICADHFIVHREADMGVDGERCALLMMDVGTRITDVAPVKAKSASEAVVALKNFVGNHGVKSMYSDNAPELKAAGRTLVWPHATSTPYQPQSNSLIERQVGVIIQGTRASLLQSGLPHKMWPFASKHHAMATNMTVSASAPDGLSPYERHMNEPFPGMMIPFGALVHYRPPKPVLDTLPKFAPRSCHGIFLGWYMRPGMEFKGDYLVLPMSGLDAEAGQIPIHRIKEVRMAHPVSFPLQKLEDVPLIQVEAAIENARDDDLVALANDREIARKILMDDLDDMFGTPEEIESATITANDELEQIDLTIPDGPSSSSTRIDPPLPVEHSVRPSALRTRPRDIPEEEWNNMNKKQKREAIQRSREAVSYAAVAKVFSPSAKRAIIEFCCSDESKIGEFSKDDPDCVVYRLTEKEDMTTDSGLEHAINIVDSIPADWHVLLWGSLPCTAGSPWQRINVKHAGARAKIDANIEIFESLILNFVILARHIKLRKSSDIAYEWPKECELWSRPEVENMTYEFGLNKISFHGCALGLTAEDGIPIKKPWTVATSSKKLADRLGQYQCPGTSVHLMHHPCAGKETKRTEGYTNEMAEAIHTAHHEEAIDARATSALTAKSTEAAATGELSAEAEQMFAPPGELDIEAERMFASPPGHRPKNCPPGLWCSLVTKTIHPKDPLSRCPQAIKAIDVERMDLEKMGTWDSAHPFEAENAARLYPDAHFARVFAIVGIKHYEQGEEHHKWKGRIVLSGDKIKTATGDWAVFAELGNVPSTMSACRALLSVFAVTDDLILLQSDCVRAYVQATLKGPPTFIRLPKAWQPEAWSSFKDPVCRLVKALYGHPHAGDFWHDRFQAELITLEFKTIDGWPSVYVRELNKKDRIIICVYVDDLVILGPKAMYPVLEALRKEIEMDDPHPLNKYLGCFHHFLETTVNGEKMMTIQFDMADYFKSACEIFVAETGETLKPASTPFAPEINSEDLDHLLSTPGRFSSKAASFIMKLMYGARMAMPQLCVIVSRLASQITRWSADSDRRLLRVYGYLHANADQILTGTLSKSDRKHLKIVAWPDADLNGDFMSTKSTDGFFVELAGREGRGFPLAWGSHKQGSTAMHTAEAETVSLAHCCRQELIPLQILLQAMLGEAIDCVVKEDNAACIIAVTKGYSPSLRHLKRTQRIALGHLHEIFFEDEHCDGPATTDGKFTLEKAATADHKGDLFTKELHPAQFNHALNLIRVGCKAIAPPPKTPIPDSPGLEKLRKAAVSISARQRRWGSGAGKQATEDKKKAIPEIGIPVNTTKAAPAIVIDNHPTEEGKKNTDKYGAPPPPPDEPCPAHLGREPPPPPPCRNRGAPSPSGETDAVLTQKTAPLVKPPPNLPGSNNTARPPAPVVKPPPPSRLWYAPAATSTTATTATTGWTPPPPAPPRRIHWAPPRPPLPDERMHV